MIFASFLRCVVHSMRAFNYCRVARLAPCLIAICALPGISFATVVQVDRSYSWGALRLSSGTLESVIIDGASFLKFESDVVADVHYATGAHILIATGSLTIEQA